MLANSYSSASAGALTLALVATLSPARAQEPGPRAAAGVDVQAFSFADPSAAGSKSVLLVAAPFAARLLALPALSIDALGAYARGSVRDAAGNTLTLSGFTDTEVRATVPFQGAHNSLALTARALIPTGLVTMDQDQLAVAGLIASNLLPFRISTWGVGGGGGGEATATHAGERGSVGATVGYRVSGSFQPLAANAGRYRPGNEAALRLAAEQTVGGAGNLSLQLSAAQYSNDQWDGAGLLRPGMRIFALGGYTAPVGAAAAASFYGGALYRSGAALSESGAFAGLLAGAPAPPSETLLLAGGSLRLPWAQRVLVPALDVRALSRADGTGQGWLASLGGSAELPLGDSGARLVPSARVHLGRLLVASGVSSGVTGAELGLGITFGGAR